MLGQGEPTPTQAAAVARSLAFRAEIDRRAALVPQKPDTRRFIPNTPYGVPKISPKITREPPLRPWYHVMWFFDLVNYRPRRCDGAIRIDAIQQACRRFYSISIADLCSPRRDARTVHARQVAMYLSKVLTSNSLPAIGRRFGDRDHTTVLHAVSKITRLIGSDAQVAAQVAEIRQGLGA